ncbi:phosphatase PAP2 family protein [Candidatus Falkowbacteria bacterium]|nr:phosphatase PAP2 family protein [Candidatus Falkowbacteria bacterium]
MLDLQIFQFLNGLASKNAILDLAGIFLADYLIWLLFFVVIILGLLPPTKKGETLSKGNALKSIAGALLGGALAIVIGQFISRPRPFLIDKVNLLISPPLTTMSFPSLHTTIAFAFSCTLFLFNKKIGAYYLVAAILIGLSRVYVGVHYPLDILFGALIGCVSALVIKKLTLVSNKFTKKS